MTDATETTDEAAKPRTAAELSNEEAVHLKALCWEALRQCVHPGGEVRLTQPVPGFFRIELHERAAIFGLKGKAPVIEPMMLVLAKLLEHGFNGAVINEQAVAQLVTVAKSQGFEFYLHPVKPPSLASITPAD